MRAWWLSLAIVILAIVFILAVLFGLLAVANCFLDIQEGDPAVSPIDPMKLQKLLFYAHAWWLAYVGAPLFAEDVEAWPWGPVVRSIYAEFASFGREPISGHRATELVRTGEGQFDFRLRQPEPPPQNVREFIGKVWDTHKGLTGVQLSNSTHAPGEPWTIIKRQYRSLASKPRIPNSLIADVFRRKLQAQGG